MAAEAEENTIGLLFLDDIFNVFGGNREVIDFVGEHVRGLDGRDVGVNED